MASAEHIAHALGRGKETRGEDGVWRTFCPSHSDEKSPSLAVSTNAGGKVLVHCHAGCSQANVIGALKAQGLWGADKGAYETWTVTARPENLQFPSSPIKHPQHGMPSFVWYYYTASGAPLGMVYRYDLAGGKLILPMNWCVSSKGRTEWRFKGFSNPRSLYRLEELAKRPSAPIIIVEGEKTADAAAILFPDYVAMAWQGGSKSPQYADVAPLKGRDVILWRDNDQPGIDAMQRMAENLKGIASRVRHVDVPASLPEGWDLADSIPGNIDPKTLLLSAQELTLLSEDVIAQMNRTYALVLIGDKAVIIEDQVLPTGKVQPRYLNVAAFNQYFSNQLVPQGRKEIPVSKYWLEHPDRRTYKGVIFHPGAEATGYYNLWRGFSVEPDPTGDCSMLLEHLKENIAQGNESLYKWLLGWFAQMVQHPTVKPGTSLAIRGKMGTGKTIIGKSVGRLFRAHYVLVDNPKHVYGSFNQHFVNCLLLHADEGFWAGDAKHAGMLKGLVTAETQRIEPKGKDTFEVDSYIRLLTTSNDSFIVPAAFEERRFAVVDAGVGRMQDVPYFRAMEAQLENGGYGRLLYELQRYDLSNIDIWHIPQTSALVEQKQFSMNGVLQFWYDVLMAGNIGDSSNWPEAVLKDDLYEYYVASAQQRGDRYRSSKIDFGRKMAEVHPNGGFKNVRLHITRHDKRTQVAIERREWGLEMPNLEALRKRFDEILGEPQHWPPVDKDEVPGSDIPF